MATVTTQFKNGLLLLDDEPTPPGFEDLVEIYRWDYPGQPYLVGAGIPTINPVLSSGDVSFVPVAGTPFVQDGTITWTYGEGFTNGTVSVRKAMDVPPVPFFGGRTASRQVHNGTLSGGVIYNTGLFNREEEFSLGDGQEIFVGSSENMNIEMKYNSISTIKKTDTNTAPGDFGSVGFFISALEDVKDGDAPKQLLFRTLQVDPPALSGAPPYLPLTSQVPSSWLEFQLPPVARATMAINEEDVARIDASKSYDLDDGIDYFEFKVGAISIDVLMEETGERIFEFSVDAFRALASVELPEGSTLAVSVTAVDRAGNRSTTVVSALIRTTLDQQSAFWHPNNALYTAQNSTGGVVFARRAQPHDSPETLATIAGTKNPTAWQRRAANRPSGTFEMLARKDGATWRLYRSTDGGTTWSIMGQPPFEVTNIDYMTAVPVGGGYVVLAIIKGTPNKLVSKRTADANTWPSDADAKTVRSGVANKPITLNLASDGRRDFSVVTFEGVLTSSDGETWT